MPSRSLRVPPACTYCRQMKHKCDARDTYPASCTRCARRHIDCVLDRGFRRTAKRERYHAVEEELERLKATDVQTPTTTLPLLYEQTVPAVLPAPPERSVFLPNRDHAPTYDSPVSIAPSYINPVFETQRINDIEILPSAVSQLLHLYYAQYHDRLPILPGFSNFTATYADCQLLFWTIVALTSQHTLEYSHLRPKLLKPIHRLASDVLEAARHPIATVQALLLLCWWPLDLSNGTAANPTWSYCGTALHTALRCGLHRPADVADFEYFGRSSAEVVQVRRNTWSACVFTNQTISCYLGIPATVPINRSSFDAVEDSAHSLPLVLEQLTKIAYQDHEVCQLLDNLTHVAEFEPWMDTLNRRYQSLRLEIGPSCSYEVELAFLKAQLNLYSFLCVACFDQNTPPIWATAYLIESTKCASRLIEVASTSAKETSLWCTETRRSMYNAVFYLLKISAASSRWDFINLASARSSIQKAWELLRNASRQKHDQYDRVCSVIEYISSQAGGNGEYGTTVSVRSRMASNIVYDTIFCAKQRFSRELRESRPVDLVLAAEEKHQRGASKNVEEWMDLSWDALLDLSFLEADFNIL